MTLPLISIFAALWGVFLGNALGIRVGFEPFVWSHWTALMGPLAVFAALAIRIDVLEKRRLEKRLDR
jgi:hypothetical protein